MTPEEIADRVVSVQRSLADPGKKIRFRLKDGDATDWGKLAFAPVASYLEISEAGPYRVRDISACDIWLSSDPSEEQLGKLHDAGFRRLMNMFTLDFPEFYLERPPEIPQVVSQRQYDNRADREKQNSHRGAVIWFTGLRGSGKTTIANETDLMLRIIGIHTMLLDEDIVRHGLCAGPNFLVEHGPEFAQRFGLGIGPLDCEEYIRRVGSVSQLLASAGLIVLTNFVSPFRRDRAGVRRWVESQGRVGDFIEVFVDAPKSICDLRDPKGLLPQVRAGKITDTTGINDPYEAPESPDIHLKSAKTSPSELATEVVNQLRQRKLLPAIPT